MKVFSNSKSNLWIALLFGYVILQFSWWAYMLIDLHTELYEQQLIIAENTSIDELGFLSRSKELAANLSLKVWMVLGEGSVFLLLLILGFLKVKQSISKEIAVAEEKTNFLHAVTHELNTPIAAIQLQTQTMLSRNINEDKRTEILKGTLKETKRLKVLIDNILLSSKAEKHQLHLNTANINLKIFSEKIIARIKQSNLGLFERIVLNVSKDISVIADEAALESIYLNLIENFEKYVPSGSLTISYKQGYLLFDDHGSGIPANKQEKVLEKFIRLQNENTRTTKGTGLGLYIVNQLVKAHGWKLNLTENEPKGLKVEILIT